MSHQHLNLWRTFIYTHKLYSLPHMIASTRNYRSYRPSVYSDESWELSRIMRWVNLELSVLITSDRLERQRAYDTILSMLPQVEMHSAEFSQSLASYFGNRTEHFVHELVNFARSPYDDIISYECNIMYRALNTVPDDDEPSTSTAAASASIRQETHNFIEFSQRISTDEHCGMDFDFQENANVAEEINAMIAMAEYNEILMAEMRDQQQSGMHNRMQQHQAPAPQQQSTTAAPPSAPTSNPRSTAPATVTHTPTHAQALTRQTPTWLQQLSELAAACKYHAQSP